MALDLAIHRAAPFLKPRNTIPVAVMNTHVVMIEPRYHRFKEIHEQGVIPSVVPEAIIEPHKALG